MAALTFLHGLGSVAAQYGAEEAVFLHVIVSYARNNKANDRNFRDGRWWTYNSLSAWEVEFPWWSSKQIRRIIASCEKQGALILGEYNTDRRDRTAWYSPSDALLEHYNEVWEGKCMCPNGQMHVPERADSSAQMGTTIPKESKNNIHTCVHELVSVFSDMAVADNDRLSDAQVRAALEEHGYSCRTRVSVPARDSSGLYSGRIGFVAEKAGVTVAIEKDRKSVREKSVYKLREFDCDVRIVLLREGNADYVPTGIDAIIPLRTDGCGHNAPKDAPDWKPERFAGFWKFYPRHENKQAAIRAWDKLRPGDELIDRMAAALVVLKATPDWTRGIGIPHASTWLNNARWEDAEQPQAAEAGVAASGWAEDPEVLDG